jgi:aryl carrier-like protein
MGTSTPLTRERLRADVADVLGEEPADILDDENLVDFGLDSVRVMTLIGRWRREHGVRVEFADLAERPTLLDWARVLDVRD